ncbi:hypothetical protein BSAE_1908 [Bifidobacterium pullorum subsp. saeculare DSM 6531 = LMG 14934]|uniref:Uncharacterized protein n=1 Tax=Bifidobacterium pullorum subsp. saeculare DSM 6531 = LMG 14934 TaxID=1437611 RepID=A0A087CPY0_9BIFI|nr:hypothetical protein BSAE_1908 [Bifidobacterium pullorum subsp. saeculare DSM 6531 = LMG 14934]
MCWQPVSERYHHSYLLEPAHLPVSLMPYIG